MHLLYYEFTSKNPTKEKAMQRRIIKWTTDGWTKTDKVVKDYVVNKTNGKEYIMPPLRKHISDISEPFSQFSPNPEVQMITEAQKEISYGRHSDKIDQFPQSIRQIFEDAETWYIASNKLFKAIDLEDQVKINGNWGIDGEDLHSDPKSKVHFATRIFIEDANLLNYDQSYRDIMDTYETNNTIIDVSPLTRTTIDPSNIGYSPEHKGTFEDNIQEEEELYESEEDLTNIDYRNPEMKLPILSEETMSQVSEIVTQYENAIQSIKDKDDIAELRKQVEESIDSIIYHECVGKIDSPFHAFKYIPPKKQYNFIPGEFSSDLVERADERKQFFNSGFKKILSSKSMDDLYGDLVPNPDPEKFGEMMRGGGYYGDLREHYMQDRQIINDWTIKDRVDDQGNVTEESQFNIQRRQMLNYLRQIGKDEELIRRTLFAYFDRGTNLISDQDYPASIWLKHRSKAFLELSMTKAQWSAIFWAIDVVKHRFKLDKTSERSEEEKNKVATINRAFLKMRDMHDIKLFNTWIYNRKGNKSYQFEKAPIDYLSIKEEQKLKDTVNLANKHFQKQYEKILDISTTTEGNDGETTSLPEISVSCPHIHNKERCISMVTGKPRFIKTQEDGKGYLFLYCDNCRKKIVVHEYKDEQLVPKTLQELIENYGGNNE
jgi:hypothetical protein